MANKILIIGPSGFGKSHSAQYLDPKETFYFHCDDKELPFKGWRKNYRTIRDESGKIKFAESNYVETDNFSTITVNIPLLSRRRPEIKVIVIDTITNAMFRSVMRERENDNWKKYLDFAAELDDLLLSLKGLREDLTVVFMAHEELAEKGNKTLAQYKIPGGKFTREKLDPESRFTTVLFANCRRIGDKNFYWFETQNNGFNTCKSPNGMFPAFRIPNNLKYVIESVKAFENGTVLPEMPPMEVDDSKLNEENF